MHCFLTRRLVTIIGLRNIVMVILDSLCSTILIFFVGEHLVSVGGYIYLWDWRRGILVTKLKASSSCSAVTSVTFSSDSKYIVTAGKKHLKFWAVGASPRTRMYKGTISLSIHAKPISLGPQKGSSFVSVSSAIRTESTDGSVVNCNEADDLFSIYALTDAG